MGRQLASFDGITYTYNEDGIRTSKTVNGERTYYYVDGTQLFEQTIGNDCGLHFFYDRNGELTAFARYYEDDEPIQDLYYYVKNAQGDITDITDDWGNIIASYTYDPWGKVLSVTGSDTVIGNLNPFRYRGYYYDDETGLYYLQSRYYDPEVGRFINCDDVRYIGATQTELSYNVFAYCENEPVNFVDQSGTIKFDVAWKQLGFTYNLSNKKDIQRKEAGKWPVSYSIWLKNGKRREVKEIYVVKFGVKTSLVAITYIPKNKTYAYYLSLGGDNTLSSILLGISGAVLGIAGKAPGIGKILGLISLMEGMKNLVLYSDKKSFKKEMDKGIGVAIIEFFVWSATFGGSTTISYKSWNGKGDLYDFF